MQPPSPTRRSERAATVLASALLSQGLCAYDYVDGDGCQCVRAGICGAPSSGTDIRCQRSATAGFLYVSEWGTEIGSSTAPREAAAAVALLFGKTA